MRSASTEARSEEISGQLIASQCKAECAIYFENTDGEWQLLEHLNEEKGIDWDESGQRFDFSNINLVPACATINFEVLNPGGLYSPGSGYDLDNVLDIDTRIKLKAGYLLEDVGKTTSEAMSIIEGFMASAITQKHPWLYPARRWTTHLVIRTSISRIFLAYI